MMKRLGLSPQQMLEEMAKRTGGIPDFAKKTLVEKGGLTKAQVDAADKKGRQP